MMSSWLDAKTQVLSWQHSTFLWQSAGCSPSAQHCSARQQWQHFGGCPFCPPVVGHWMEGYWWKPRLYHNYSFRFLLNRTKAIIACLIEKSMLCKDWGWYKKAKWERQNHWSVLSVHRLLTEKRRLWQQKQLHMDDLCPRVLSCSLR